MPISRRLQESAHLLYGISLPDRLASDVVAQARRGSPCARLAIDLDPRRGPGHQITYRSRELSPGTVFPPPAGGKRSRSSGCTTDSALTSGAIDVSSMAAPDPMSIRNP